MYVDNEKRSNFKTFLSPETTLTSQMPRSIILMLRCTLEQ